MVDGEIKRIVPEENEEFLDLIQYSFFPDQGSVVKQPGPLGNLFRTGYEGYGYYEGDELLFGILGNDLGATLRGDDTNVTVLRYGATQPEHRRTGVLGRALPELFQYLGERGMPFILSREFKSGMYERVGATRICNWTRWQFLNEALLSTVEEPRGQFRRLGMDDLKTVNRIHRKYTDRYSLSINRTEQYWQSLVNPHGKRHHVAGWELDGELRGYVVYRFRDSAEKPGMKQIDEIDMGYLDHEAYRHLLYFLGNHDSQAIATTIVRPHGMSTIDVLKRQKNTVQGEMETGPIMRVNDVESALRAPSYPSDVSESVTIRVRDDLIAANDGVYDLTVRNGRATCTPTDGDPDATIDVSVIPQMLVGFREVERLEQLFDLSVRDAETREALSRMFPSRRSFVRDEI